MKANLLHEKAGLRLGKCLSTLDERGVQHGDTLRKLVTPFLDSTFREMGIDPVRLSLEQKQKVALAGQCDIKTTRIAAGNTQDDSATDLINYVAAWSELDASPRESIL